MGRGIVSILASESLICAYDNIAPPGDPANFYFADSSNGQTFVPSEAARVQLVLTDGAAIQSQVPNNSALRMYAAQGGALLAEWVVSLNPNLAAYPLALSVVTPSTSTTPVVAGQSYYFELATDGTPPPPPPPPAEEGTMIFLGDSRTAFWPAEKMQAISELVEVNEGVSGYRVGDVLNDIISGSLDEANPEWICVWIGTNNVPDQPTATIAERAAPIIAGVTAIVGYLRYHKPNAKIILMAEIYRYDAYGTPEANQVIDAANAKTVALAQLPGVYWIDLRSAGIQLADGVHLTAGDYDIPDAAIAAVLAGNYTPPNQPAVPTTMTVSFSIAGGAPVQTQVLVGAATSVPFTTKVEA